MSDGSKGDDMKVASRQKSIVSVFLFLAVLWQPILSLAAVNYDWAIPDNVRIVQSAPVDNQRIFPTIGAAITSLPSPSESNRYVIKVMPGVYTVNDTITLPAGVDLIGSGQEATVITSSSISNVLLLNNSTTVENLAITSTATANTGDLITISTAATTTFRNVTVDLPKNVLVRGVFGNDGSTIRLIHSKILLSGAASTGPDTAIELRGISSGSIEIVGSFLDLRFNSGNYGVGIAPLYNASLSMRDSVATITNTGTAELVEGRDGPVTIKNCNINIQANAVSGIYGGANVEISDSEISATGTDVNSTRVCDLGGWTQVTVNNSVIVSNGYSFNPANNLKVNNSSITGNITKTSGSFFIGNSQLVGTHNGVGGVDKIINCYNGDYNPIVFQ